MSCPEEACRAASKLAEISEPQKGGLKAYTPYHAYKTLELLEEHGSLGRPRLVKLLSLGEASVKTLLTKLEEHNLIERTTRGHTLTEKGKKIRLILSETLLVRELNIPGLFEESKKIIHLAIPCVPSPRTLTDVYRIRDHLVVSQCTVSLIGGIVDGRILFPGAPEDVVRLVEPFIVNRGVNIYVPEQCKDFIITAGIRILLDHC